MSKPITDKEPECWRCGRTLAAYLTRPWSLKCKRCKAQNRGGEPLQKEKEDPGQGPDADTMARAADGSYPPH